MIGAIVLAAGESKRMGTQKLVLPYAGATVIAHIVDRLLESDLAELLVVTGHEPHRIQTALGDRDIRLIQNDHYQDGMLSSVRAGFAAVGESWDAALVVLGDQPSIQTENINRLIQQSQEHPGDLILPTFQGKRGHPILIPLHYRTEIMEQFEEVGLRGLLRAHPDKITEAPVETSSILDDIDYPKDYQQALKKLEE